jgi:hypothetical protein
VKKTTLPTFVRPFLWSFDLQNIDLEKHKKRIITNVLNLGTKKATDWLFETYSKEDIKAVLVNPIPGEWSRKSFHFWTFLFHLNIPFPKRKI